MQRPPIRQLWLQFLFSYSTGFDGTYVYQPDFDPATKELMEECAHILHDIPKDIVDTNITCPQWQYQWGKANGCTSST